MKILSPEDSLIFANAITSEREPNEKLKELFSKDNDQLLRDLNKLSLLTELKEYLENLGGMYGDGIVDSEVEGALDIVKKHWG